MWSTLVINIALTAITAALPTTDKPAEIDQRIVNREEPRDVPSNITGKKGFYVNVVNPIEIPCYLLGHMIYLHCLK